MAPRSRARRQGLLQHFILASVLTLGAYAEDSEDGKPSKFWDMFEVDYCDFSIKVEDSPYYGEVSSIHMTKDCGARFRSKRLFQYGEFSVKMRTPHQNSRGVCGTFYVSTPMSNDRRHLHEIDVEFLNSGDRTKLQTNWWADGEGDHEDIHPLWFDPTIAFHEYTIVWRKDAIIWKIDGNVVRTVNATGRKFFPSKPMHVYGSVWEARKWLGYVDWKFADYVTWYKDWSIQPENEFNQDGTRITGAGTSVGESPLEEVNVVL